MNKRKAKWIIAIFLWLLALGATHSGGIEIISGLFLLIAGFFVSPLPEKIPQLMNFFKRYKGSRYALVIGLFIISIIIIPSKPHEEKEDDVSKSSPMISETTTIFQTTTNPTTTVQHTSLTTTQSTTLTTTSTTVQTTTAQTTTITTTTIITTTVYVPPAPQAKTYHLILNTDTNCVHINEHCSAAEKILPENYAVIDIEETDLGTYEGVYWACGKCCDSTLRKALPKP